MQWLIFEKASLVSPFQHTLFKAAVRLLLLGVHPFQNHHLTETTMERFVPK